MVRTNLFYNTPTRKVIEEKGCFSVIEYMQDISVEKDEAMEEYFASQMNLRRRQLAAKLSNTGVSIEAGKMQMLMGSVHAATNVTGAGDLFKKIVGSKVTGETAIKPRYVGDGVVVLEPTYKYILLEDMADWDGALVIDDGYFLACEDSVNLSVTSRSNLSSAILGGEGLFSTMLSGMGIAAIESAVPREELMIVDLIDDEIKIDGNMAIAWSNSLRFTVEKSMGTLVGSAVSGEGFVNVYRGTGRVLIAPVTDHKK